MGHVVRHRGGGLVLLLSRLLAVGGDDGGCAWSRSARHPNILNFIGICTPEKTQDSSRCTLFFFFCCCCCLLLLLLPLVVAMQQPFGVLGWCAGVLSCPRAPSSLSGQSRVRGSRKAYSSSPSGYPTVYIPFSISTRGGGPHLPSW